MLVRNSKTFNLGIILGVTFFCVLGLIFSPIYGNGMNGLDFADDLFNKLSKGSSYFIPDITKQTEKFTSSQVAVTVKMEKPEQAATGAKLVTAAGGQGEAQGAELKVSGGLGKLLQAVLKDSDAMYKNNGAEVKGRYGMDEKEVMTVWWNMFSKADKELKKQKKVDESNLVNEVLKKGVEPAFNYYGIEAQSVMDKAFLMSALLIFYVVYTMWWGYAIFYLFDGLGLSMKKAKVKKEV